MHGYHPNPFLFFSGIKYIFIENLHLFIRSEVSAENHSPRTQCSDCSLDGRCITYCPCLNWDTTGSMTQVPGILCAFESMVIPVADRIARTLFKEKNRSFMKKHY
jgi:hypothetical protein